MVSNYPVEFKDAMIHKMTSAGGKSATSLGKEVGIAQSTLSEEYESTGGLTGIIVGSCRLIRSKPLG
jgi:hypothetical protein